MIEHGQYDILCQLKDGSIVLDRDYTIVFVNQQFLDMTGMARTEVIGRKCYEISHHRRSSCTEENLFESPCGHKQACKTGLPVTTIHSHFLPDGSQVMVEVFCSPIKDEDGSVVRILQTVQNITEHKRAERLLDESEGRFREIFNNMSSGVVIYEAVEGGNDFIIKDFNPSVCRSTRLEKEDVVGKRVRDVFPGIEEFGLFEVLQHVFMTGQPEQHPTAMYKEDRLELWVESYVCKLPTGEVVSICEDVTQREKDHAALRQSEARYSSLFHNNHTVMLLIDPGSADIIDANPAACAYYGYGKDELLAMKISDINMLDCVELDEIIVQTLSAEGAHFFLQHRLKNGDIRDVEVFSGPITISDRTSIFSVIHDITDRKRAERDLARSKEEWEKTFHSFTDVVTLQDTDLHILKINKMGCSTLDLSCDEIIGRNCYELFDGSEEPCQDCPLLETKKTFQPYTREMHHEKLGKTFLVSAAPVFDEQGELEYIVHVAKDISELKQLESKLFQAQKMEAIGTLAGGIAHDFNNILSAIIGYSELIRNRVPADSDVGRDIVEVIESGKRAAGLVKQILTFSRKAEIRKQHLHPHLIVNEALKMLRAVLPTTIYIEEDIDPDCGVILAGSTNIHQIVINLCTNALQAMADEKGTLHVSLRRRVPDAAEIKEEPALSSIPYVVLTVTDTGCGMDQATLERIFDPYFTTKEMGQGTGLGLAVIHGIVQDANGVTRVKSTLGEGSSFAVYFPVLQEQSSTLSELTRKTPLQGGNEHILVVDDEPLIVRVTQRQLADFGYKVTITTNSKDALEKIRTEPEQFDLLITDQTMPGLTGAELARAVRDVNPDLPIILCTGHSCVVSEEDALDMGIKKYVSKPIVEDELVHAVRSVLDCGPGE